MRDWTAATHPKFSEAAQGAIVHAFEEVERLRIVVAGQDKTIRRLNHRIAALDGALQGLSRKIMVKNMELAALRAGMTQEAYLASLHTFDEVQEAIVLGTKCSNCPTVLKAGDGVGCLAPLAMRRTARSVRPSACA